MDPTPQFQGRDPGLVTDSLANTGESAVTLTAKLLPAAADQRGMDLMFPGLNLLMDLPESAS